MYICARYFYMGLHNSCLTVVSLCGFKNIQKKDPILKHVKLTKLTAD